MNVSLATGFKKTCPSNIIYRENVERWGCDLNMTTVSFKSLHVVFEKAYQPNKHIHLCFLINIGTKDLTHLSTVYFLWYHHIHKLTLSLFRAPITTRTFKAPIRTLLPPEPLAIGGWLGDQPTPVCHWSKTGMINALWNGISWSFVKRKYR